MTATVEQAPRTRTLSKSDYALAVTCEAKLYFRENDYPDRRDDDPYLRMLAYGGYMVEALAREQYPNALRRDYSSDPQRDFDWAMEQLSRGDVTLCGATLLWNRRLARADILEKKGKTIRLIEVKAKSFDGAEHASSLASGGKGCFRTKTKPFGVRSEWKEKMQDVAYQALLLEKLFPDHTIEPFLTLVDTSKRAQVDNIPQLFEVVRRVGPGGSERIHTAHFVGDRALLPRLDVLTTVGVAEEVALVRDEVDEAATRFEALLDSPREEFEPAYGSHCSKCEYNTADNVDLSGFRDCWGELADAAPHVLDLYKIGTVKATDGSTMIEFLVKAGKGTLFDIPLTQLARKDGTIGPDAERQLRQIDCTRSGNTWRSTELEQKIESVTYPLHFVDFEASRLALPYHSGMRPYGLTAFQWSCYTVATPGAAPVHSEWLNGENRWPNAEFVRSLRAAISDDGAVLTWSPFERSTITDVAGELAKFDVHDAELVAWMTDVKERRMADLHTWAQKDFYHPGMGGRTSIKVVLDALWRCDDELRAQFEQWSGRSADATSDPYASLPAIEINGIRQDVVEGTGAIRAYEAMMYGVEKDDPVAKAQWRELLLQYCKLDTLSMILIFEYWKRLA